MALAGRSFTTFLRWRMTMFEESFDAGFADSPIKRLGLEGLKRNARICLANV